MSPRDHQQPRTCQDVKNIKLPPTKTNDKRLGVTRSSPRPTMSSSGSDDVILGPRRLLRPPSVPLRSGRAEEARRVLVGGRQEPVEPGQEASSLRSAINFCSKSFVKFFSRLNSPPAVAKATSLPCGRASSLTDHPSQQSPSWRLERDKSPQSSPAMLGPPSRARSSDSIVPPRPSLLVAVSQEKTIQLLALQAKRRRSSTDAPQLGGGGPKGGVDAHPASTPAEAPGPHSRRHRPSRASAIREQQDRKRGASADRSTSGHQQTGLLLHQGTSADRSRRQSSDLGPRPTLSPAESRALLDKSRRRWSSMS